ncbi:MAG: sulfatase-like hydrolase/transferase [Candidatus Omnitrophota bacterium]
MGQKNKSSPKSIIAESLKITTAITFLLISIESLGNYTFFYQHFPRKGFFTLIFNSTVLKFISLPILQLTLVTFMVYLFIIFFFVYALFSLKQGLGLSSKKASPGFLLFSAISIYIALYAIYGFNGFLCPDSQGRHFFLYKFFLAQENYHQPLSFWVQISYYLSAVYWLGLFLFTLKVAKSRVVLITMPLIAGLIIALSLVAANFLLVKEFKKRDNIILIGLDSMQYNQLCKKWGYEKDLAPNICSFLENSTSFINAWSPFARTYPSYLSILTGRYPINNGARANLVPDQHIKTDNIYLGDILKGRGYHGLHCTDDVRFSNIRGEHGFDQLFSPRKDVSGIFITAFYDYALGNIMIQKDILAGLFSPIIHNRAHVAYNPKAFIKALIKRINRLPQDQRQFIVIHLCGNHQPYSSPYPYTRDENLISSSERCIAMVDDQFAELVEYLKKSGLYDNSIIVLLSDHGCGWSSNKTLLTHGSDFYYPWANRMVLAFGPNLKLNAPQKINALVRSIDIYPTVLEMLDVDIPEGIDGKSLMSLIQGEEAKPRKLFAESGYSFGFDFSQEVMIDPKSIRSELKRFNLDPQAGFTYIHDDDYQELIKKKWYMLIDKDQRLIHNPFLNITEVFKVDRETGKDISLRPQGQDSQLYSVRGEELLSELKRHFKLE